MSQEKWSQEVKEEAKVGGVKGRPTGALADSRKKKSNRRERSTIVVSKGVTACECTKCGTEQHIILPMSRPPREGEEGQPALTLAEIAKGIMCNTCLTTGKLRPKKDE